MNLQFPQVPLFPQGSSLRSVWSVRVGSPGEWRWQKQGRSRAILGSVLWAANLSWCRRQRRRAAGVGEGETGQQPHTAQPGPTQLFSGLHFPSRLRKAGGQRGSPRHVLLPAGQSLVPGVQHQLPHALSPAIPKAPWLTPQPCPSPGEEWWTFLFLKHRPLQTKESLGTPEIPTGVRRLMLSCSPLEGHQPPKAARHRAPGQNPFPSPEKGLAQLGAF